MTTEQFTYWLQGFFEISDSKKLNEKQVQIIKDHMALVFDKQTPDRNESAKKKISPMEIGHVKDSKAWDFDPNQPLCNESSAVGSEVKPGGTRSRLYC